MRSKLILSAVVIALVAAACGSDTTTPAGGGTPTGTSPTPSERPSIAGTVDDRGTVDRTGDGNRVELTIEADDSYFKPTFIKATPGATINVEIENEGQAPHTFTIDSLQVDVELAAGEKGETTFEFPEGQTLVFYCRFHRAQGMQGAFFA